MNRVQIPGLLLGLLLAGRQPAQAATPPLPPPPDSLKNVLKGTSGAARYQALLRIAWACDEELDSRLVPYAQAAAQAARADDNPEAEGEAYDALGDYYVGLQEPNRALPLLRRAQALLANAAPTLQARNALHRLGLYIDLGRPAEARQAYRQGMRLASGTPEAAGLKANLLNAWGGYYLGQHMPDSALYYLLRVVRQQHALQQPGAEGAALYNAAAAFYMQEDWPRTERYAHQALALQRRYEPANVAPTLNLLAVAAREQAHYSRALYYARWQKQELQRLHNQGDLPALSVTLGNLHLALGRPDSAEWAYHRALAEAADVPGISAETLPSIWGHLASLQLSQGRLAEAAHYAGLAQGGSQRLGMAPIEIDALTVLIDVARQRRDFAQALDLTTRRQQLRDTLAQHESRQLAQEMRARFDTDRAEAAVQLLTREQELADLRHQRRLLALGLATLLALALAGGAVLLLRRRQQRREAQLRQKLAADLHDDVGSLLTRISLESSLLNEGLADAEEQHTRRANLVDVSQQALRQMSDVVWSVSHAHTTLPQVLERMREHGYELLPAAGLELDFYAEPGVEKAALSSEALQHLYLIYKEALHNAVKHAQGATAIIVELRLDGPALTLRVQDNGPGRAAPGRLDGHGLDNMRRRAAEAGGTVSYDTAPGQGFAVRLSLPLAGQRMAARIS